MGKLAFRLGLGRGGGGVLFLLICCWPNLTRLRLRRRSGRGSRRGRSECGGSAGGECVSSCGLTAYFFAVTTEVGTRSLTRETETWVKENIDWPPPAYLPTWDLAHNLGPDWESNRQPLGEWVDAQPLSYTSGLGEVSKLIFLLTG
uniref:Uncharacterized protein n=1 Tax=Molossus molossus TaxID=27622 RepID=A0A7J8JVQ4_MOLMO|nr:hypothetical protein HJG59_007930 [Molossus molossus]